jgi:lipopolysaccharide transport system permease protein
MDQNISGQESWTQVISARRPFFSFPVREVMAYKDLLFLFVRRDFVAFYKQTILGPIWFFIQPILTTIVFTIIFGRVANISTDGVPDILFYLAGITAWNYFSACWNETTDIFRKNQDIFGKVYFPRVIMPLSVVITNLIRFGIQFLLFLFVFFYYFFFQDAGIQPNLAILLLPLLVLMMAMFSLALGMLVSALTVKYRDLVFLMQFAIQLAMYASPVVYPLSLVSPEKHWILLLNPMTAIIETFRFGFLGSGTFNPLHLAMSFAIITVFLVFGLFVFNKTEKSFMDIV